MEYFLDEFSPIALITETASWSLLIPGETGVFGYKRRSLTPNDQGRLLVRNRSFDITSLNFF